MTNFPFVELGKITKKIILLIYMSNLKIRSRIIIYIKYESSVMASATSIIIP